MNYIVFGNKPWNHSQFKAFKYSLPGDWLYFDGLNPKTIEILDPKYCFFLHWSEKIPKEIWANYECIGFHLANLPFGRGGTPLQNQINSGARSTKITAFRIQDEMDSGPIYIQRDISLEGLAEEVYIRATKESLYMIHEIVIAGITPTEQMGLPVRFRRRKPRESLLPPGYPLWRLFDFMRMLDADGYPRAYLEYGGYRLEFKRPALRDGRIEADVSIRRLK